MLVVICDMLRIILRRCQLCHGVKEHIVYRVLPDGHLTLHQRVHFQRLLELQVGVALFIIGLGPPDRIISFRVLSFLGLDQRWLDLLNTVPVFAGLSTIAASLPQWSG